MWLKETHSNKNKLKHFVPNYKASIKTSQRKYKFILKSIRKTKDIHQYIEAHAIYMKFYNLLSMKLKILYSNTL